MTVNWILELLFIKVSPVFPPPLNFLREIEQWHLGFVYNRSRNQPFAKSGVTASSDAIYALSSSDVSKGMAKPLLVHLLHTPMKKKNKKNHGNINWLGKKELNKRREYYDDLRTINRRPYYDGLANISTL
ncbi:hypothetical protein TorRG33x02_161420 [Trema orientale]|uniref:Uncharacterized protein n=1 Tax=Trema orientale TaxID=63057 RepID=A0A2P5ERG4_TREOI|nr:hypothetical protein TorRG33x02_161420 [Trema orientale]